MNTVTNFDIKNYLIAQNVADVRKQCGFSIEETARYLDISEADLTSLESGEQEIYCALLFDFSLIFKVSISRFYENLNNLV